MKNSKRKLSYKVGGLLNLLLIAVLIFGCWIFLNYPHFSIEGRFRWIQRQQMIGPATIIGIEDVDIDGYDKLVIADDGDSVVLCGLKSLNPYSNNFYLSHRPKTGKLTLLAAPKWGTWLTDDQFTLPVILFDEYPEAVFARISLIIKEEYYWPNWEKSYTLEAERENDGYFAFQISYPNAPSPGYESYALSAFSKISGSSYVDKERLVIPATVWLYDENGELICKEEITVKSLSMIAHEE